MSSPDAPPPSAAGPPPGEVLQALLAGTLPALFGPLDEATLADLAGRVEWVTLARGEALFRRGDPPDAWYVVASGRLQVVTEDVAGVETVIGEVGRGEGLGEAGLLTENPRSATAYAVRDTVLMRFSAAHFDEIVERHPRALLSIARTLVRRSAAEPAPVGVAGAGRLGPRAQGLNIALVPAHPGLPIADLADHLAGSLRRLGATLHLGSARAGDLGALGSSARAPEGDPRGTLFSAWLDGRAADHRFVLLEGDADATPWTRRALREADHVIVLADATRPPAIDPLERSLFGPPRDRGRPPSLGGPRHAQRTLVLIHPPGTPLPRGTARWLDARDVQRHLHLREGRPGDLDRLARTIAGSAIGLLLGAGGVRGLAHVGVLRAMEEHDVPVDHVGGTSVGAFAGGLYAMGRTPDEVMDIARRAARERPFGDFAVPVTSLLAGRRIERLSAEIFGETAIEDLWIPFFCTSCDLSLFRDVVHDRGELSRAALASCALPGVLPPQIRDGRLHVDGGTSDVLPGALMRARCPGLLVAVDVSTERELLYPADRYPTSVRALWERVRPGGLITPTLPELFMRAVSFGLARRTAAVAADADLFLRPPVERYGTTEIGAIDDIAALGYAYARKKLEGFAVPGR